MCHPNGIMMSSLKFAGMWRLGVVLVLTLNLLQIRSAENGVTVIPGKKVVECFDYFELTLKVKAPPAGNPFTDSILRGSFSYKKNESSGVDGFCDSEDGRVYRIRFMPSVPGEYNYSIHFENRALVFEDHGRFKARKGKLAGPVQTDPEHPFHFIRAGTGQHWFWNSTTTYQILGWDDETIAQSIDRLARSGVNRIRVALAGRTKDGMRWNEPLVKRTDQFKFKMEPWVAARPDNVEDPGYDVTRFNLEHFRKAERLLQRARERDINVSLIFYVDGRDKGVDPFAKGGMGGEDERRYYQYAIARFAPFANVMWDVANEYRLFRDDAWAEKMGFFIMRTDPYGHLMSVHGHEDFHFRKSPWADFAMYQKWDESGGYDFRLKNRREQMASGRLIPQVNEEYGYEDHYPSGWGGARVWPSRDADNRRRLAWEMSMAGCYQTTGERANQGTGAGADTGGGWVNGRGDEHMTMLIGYRHMIDFFSSFAWWTVEPREDLALPGTLLLAIPGKLYAAYQPKGGEAKFKLAPGVYEAKWFNPRIGAWIQLPRITQFSDSDWVSSKPMDAGDWAILLKGKR
jgi:hypothetical protein